MFTLADSDDVAEAVQRLEAMSGQIPGLAHITAGADQNRGPAAHDVVLVTRHEDAAALQAYAEHPVHQEVIAWLKPRWTQRAVVDTEDLAF